MQKAEPGPAIHASRGYSTIIPVPAPYLPLTHSTQSHPLSSSELSSLLTRLPLPTPSPLIFLFSPTLGTTGNIPHDASAHSASSTRLTTALRADRLFARLAEPARVTHRPSG